MQVRFEIYLFFIERFQAVTTQLEQNPPQHTKEIVAPLWHFCWNILLARLQQLKYHEYF